MAEVGPLVASEEKIVRLDVLILAESPYSVRNYKESRDAGDILLMVVLLKSCLTNRKFFPISERKWL